MRKDKIFIFAGLLFLTFAVLGMAQTSDIPGDWKGYALINSTIAPDATPVSAYLDGSSSAATSTTVGAVEASTGYYLLHVPRGGINVTFKICGVTAYPSNNTPQTWSAGPHPQGSSPYYNISISTQANGAACTYACGCSGGYCNSNVCASSAPTTTTTTSTSSGGGTSVSATTPAAVTTPAVEVTPEKTVITDTGVINDLFSSLKPSDLGVATLDASKVDVVKTGTASATTSATETIIQNALSAAIDESAKQAINNIKSEISSAVSQPVAVSAKLEVFSITSKETNKTMTVSKITLTITADRDMKNVKIVEVIPKDVAKNVSDVSFKIKPIILQADPIVQWTFDSVGKGETKDLSYTVNKKLDIIGTTTLAAGESVAAPAQPSQQPQQPAQPADMTMVYVLAAIAAIIGLIFYFSKNRKKKTYDFGKNKNRPRK